MATILVRHKVKDFDQWKTVFESVDEFHKKHHVKSAQILRNADDPHEVLVLTEFENLDQARQFGHQEELAKIMHDAGVSDQPTIYFLERAGQRSWT